MTVDILGACHEAAPAAEVAKWEIRKKLRKFHGPWPKGGRGMGAGPAAER